MASQLTVSQVSYQLNHILDKPMLIDEKAVSKFYSELSNAKNPVFIVGDEGSVAIVSILNLASLVDAKILVMPHGKGLVSPYHPLFMGVVGFAGHASAKRLLADPKVDLVVAIGARFGELAEIKNISSDAIALNNQNDQLVKNNHMLQRENDALKANVDDLQKDKRNESFLYGGLTVFLGAILVVLIPKLRGRKRFSEWQ